MSIAAFRGALDVFERLNHPAYATKTRENLARAKTLLRERDPAAPLTPR